MGDHYDIWRAEALALLADGAPFEAHWQAYQDAWGGVDPAVPRIAWKPTADVAKRSNMGQLASAAGVAMDDVHGWSVSDRSGFWQRMLERMQIQFDTRPRTVLDGPPANPVWLSGAKMNIVASCWNAPSDAPAILGGREGTSDIDVWSYGDLRAMAGRVSNGLLAHGFQPGDAVALYMPMNAICVAAYLGIVQAGLAVVSIPDSFAADEVATRLRLGGAKAVITVDAFMRGAKSVPMAPKAREAAAAIDAQVIVVGDTESGDLAWDTFLADETAFDPVACDPDAVTNILFSSGTTGEPKAIPWTHMTPIKAGADGHLHQDIHAGDVVAWPTNIGWMMGPWLIYASLLNQATIALFEGMPTGEGFINFIRKSKTSMLGLVPAIVRGWRESGAIPPGGLPDVRLFSSTGEASNAFDYLYLMSLARYEAPIIEYCGGTEIGGGHLTGSVLRPAAPATFSTPAMGLDFVILNDEQKQVAPGEHGQIFLVPPSMGLSQRLLNRDHHKEYYDGVPAGPRGQVLRRHGDEVHVMRDGFWAAGGRADDTMNLGGIKVSSIELETAMNGQPGISETAAVAVPPAAGGADQLVVFAVATDAPNDLKAALQARIKERLNPLFRIHEVVVVDALPRTASNKVMRRELRDQYQAGMANRPKLA